MADEIFTSLFYSVSLSFSLKTNIIPKARENFMNNDNKIKIKTENEGTYVSIGISRLHRCKQKRANQQTYANDNRKKISLIIIIVKNERQETKQKKKNRQAECDICKSSEWVW